MPATIGLNFGGVAPRSAEPRLAIHEDGWAINKIPEVAIALAVIGIGMAGYLLLR